MFNHFTDLFLQTVELVNTSFEQEIDPNLGRTGKLLGQRRWFLAGGSWRWRRNRRIGFAAFRSRLRLGVIVGFDNDTITVVRLRVRFGHRSGVHVGFGFRWWW